jgi:thiol:disulfide interchange protein
MESVEQLFFGGKLLGGTVWLGGPIAFSVLTHALLGAACMALFAGIVRWLHAAIASLVREAVEAILFSRSRAGARAFLTRGPDSSPLRAQSPHVRQIGGRAPPLPAVV